MGNYTINFWGFENPRRGRQARNLTTNFPKILYLKSSSEQIFSKNCRWVPLKLGRSWPRKTLSSHFNNELLAQCWVIWIRLWLQMDNPKSGRGRLPRSGHLRELFITKFKSQFKRGFTKAVVTRVGRLRAWTQGELRLYYQIRISGQLWRL